MVRTSLNLCRSMSSPFKGKNPTFFREFWRSDEVKRFYIWVALAAGAVAAVGFTSSPALQLLFPRARNVKSGDCFAPSGKHAKSLTH